jgi:hypothetical protein
VSTSEGSSRMSGADDTARDSRTVSLADEDAVKEILG